ncbi:MAG: M3 family metallopeptidase [Prevotellaceae bacterium]|jgi:peptidyl-dipeptidase Dcp|nr:M3 family metallopeptidase [Prevotellaceae bacterium]
MKNLILCALSIVVLSACNQNGNNMTNNPLLTEFNTPFQTPPFDLIKTEHYKPAFLEAMKQHRTEIDAIINNPQDPDFENCIVALDHSGTLLHSVSSIFFNLLEAERSDEMQAIAMEMMPLLTAHSDNILMSAPLFEKIKAVYNQRENAGLDPLATRTLEKLYQDFVRKGANLTESEKSRMMEINTQLATLSLQFGDNIVKEINGFKMIVDNLDDLKGLPQENIDAAAQDAIAAGEEGKWVFTPKKTSWIPFLQYAQNRELREQLYKGYHQRGDNNNDNDNKALIQKMVSLRLEAANLLGFPNHAAYVIDENMAKTPENVYAFLERIWVPALKVAKNELAAMQKIANSEGVDSPLIASDWWYYAEKLRKQKYDLDESEIKPYLQLENVRDGMFYVANKLYGITFEKRTDISLYHTDVETYEVKDVDGSHLAIFYIDYATRAGKSAGAWCTEFRSYRKEGEQEIFPLVSVVCNFPRPFGDAPVLLSWDEATTLFHEFGHALHGFFTRGDYRRIAGDIPRDMVELPSQIMENWAGEPQVLQVYAKHFQTGVVMPEALIKKLVNSSLFNQGFMIVEYNASSLLDLDWHTITQPFTKDVNEFEQKAMDKKGLIKEILPRYRSTYFSHIFDGGYSAGYYVYRWAEVLDADAFNAFKQSGDIYNQELAAKFRKYILAEGGFDDPMEQYKRFRGAAPSETPLLVKRGLQ